MPDPSALTLFLIAAAVLLVTPGPAVLYVVARSLDQGRWAGIVSTLGINVGTLFHVAAATLGVSALLVRSALAFSVVKYAGAAYLVYLGVRKLREKEDAQAASVVEPKKLTRVFYEGMLVNLTNPKTALFFFAFLPQFVDPARGSSAALQFFLLGAIFVVMAIISDSAYALLAGSLGGWLRGHLGFLRVQRYLAGSVYLGMGVVTALSGSGKK
jgi:threonine/homoserine/homoserine lactone efflux protein